MFAVRYVALLALVFWLGVILHAARWIPPAHVVGLVCGAVVLLSLTALKFLGPPPHAFFARIAIVAVMLIVGIVGRYSARTAPAVPLAINIGLGVVLLAWYARE
jgi:hypothetical protein